MTIPAELKAIRSELGELLATHEGDAGAVGRLRSLYAGDPVGFARAELRVLLTPQQEAMLRLFAGDARLLAVLSANAVGKTMAAVVAALWAVYCLGARVLALAPGHRQVSQVFLGQVRRLFYSADLPGELYAGGLRVDPASGAELIGFATSEPGRLTGYHHERLVVVLEESQGLPDWVWEHLHALASGAENRVLAIGNPGPPVGRWYGLHTKPTSQWHRLHWSALDHPNVVLGREIIAGAVTREAVAAVTSDYGTDSLHYRRIILGEFTDEDDSALCPGAWLREAVERWHAWKAGTYASGSEYITMALDPARFGADATVLAIREGTVIRELRTWRKADTMETTGRTMAAIDELVQAGTPRDRIEVVVDEPGLGGGVIDRLKEQGVSVTPFNGGKPARDAAHFVNLRAESYWDLRRRLEKGDIALPPDELLHEELTSTLWTIRSDGRTELEPKDDLRARIGRSPDRGDAVAMAFASLERFFLVVGYH